MAQINDSVRMFALAQLTGIKTDYMECDKSGMVTCGAKEYFVLTDDEADKMADERVRDSLWAFNAEFVAECAGISNERTIKAIRKMQEELCEDANEIVGKLVGNVAAFSRKAIMADGRGHFISSYDGNEQSVKIGPCEGGTHTGTLTLYVYRNN